MKVIKFYTLDITLLILSILFIKIYDALLYKYIDFWVVYYVAIILMYLSIAIGICATISFIIQKIFKSNINLHRSVKYTTIIVALISGIAGVSLYSYPSFVSLSGWDGLGYAILGIFNIAVSLASLSLLAIYCIIRMIIQKRKQRLQKNKK